MNHNNRLWEDNNPLEQQIKSLNTATQVTLVRNEKLNGLDTYVLDIKPDWQVLTDWLSVQPPWRAPRFFNFPELARSLSYRLWVRKDCYSVLKSTIEIDCEMVSFDSSNSTVNFKGKINFTDYNKPFEIKLPEEALNAAIGPIS